MVYIKNWKTKSAEELEESWPRNFDNKFYVILDIYGIEYYLDSELR